MNFRLVIALRDSLILAAWTPPPPCSQLRSVTGYRREKRAGEVVRGRRAWTPGSGIIMITILELLNFLIVVLLFFEIQKRSVRWSHTKIATRTQIAIIHKRGITITLIDFFFGEGRELMKK